MIWTRTVLTVIAAALIALPLTAALAKDGEANAKPDKEARKAAAAQKAEQFNQAVAAANTSLAAAATTAEAHANAKAIAAAYKWHKDALVVEVHVLADGKKTKLTIDADSGEVVAKPEKQKKDKGSDKPKKQKKDKDDDHDDMGGGEFDE